MLNSNDHSLVLMVEDDLAGQRLDKALAILAVRHAPEAALSRARIQKLIEGGHVMLSPARSGSLTSRTEVRDGDRLTLRLPEAAPAVPEAEAIALDILYEDTSLLVVNKPAGMVVHPAPGAERGTLVNALLAHCGDSLSGIGGVRRPGIVHRIDKDTSGLLVVAKTDRAHQGLAAQFAAHSSERHYCAVCRGWPAPLAGRIEGAIGRHPVDRKRMAVRPDGKAAVTHYTSKTLYSTGGAPLAAALECRLETGRTHQVRLHMAEHGNSLIGDPVYGRPLRLDRVQSAADRALTACLKSFARQALHAQSLGFTHPCSGQRLNFTTEPPSDMKRLAEALAPYRVDVPDWNAGKNHKKGVRYDQ